MVDEKKVLILANSSSGLYDFRNELMANIMQRAHLMASVPEGEKVEDIAQMGCKVILTEIDRRGINPATDLKLFRTYRRMLKTEKPDLVITYTIKPNIYGGLACRLAKVPYAVNITGLGTTFQNDGWLRRLVTILYRTALKKAKVVFFENAVNRDIFVSEKIVPEEKSHLLNGAGVNLQRYPFVPYPQDGPVRFLFMGRVMKEKGIDELFGAMERLHREGVDCTLDVLGYYEENYAEIIRQYEEQGWLRYHGYQSDVHPFIEKAHCFVLPSWHEGMANTNLECAAMGRPLITSNIPGCREAVVEGKSGLLCSPKDTDSLYEQLRRFLMLSPEERSAMGKVGRAHMEAVFDKNKVVEQTVKALEL